MSGIRLSVAPRATVRDPGYRVTSRADSGIDPPGQLVRAMQVLAAMNAHGTWRAASHAFCNELANQWNGERACLGIIKPDSVSLQAMSHARDFSRRRAIVQDLESAMAECADQDLETAWPEPVGLVCVNRSMARLARLHGARHGVAIPLRRDGRPAAVLVLERTDSTPIDNREIESLRLCAELCGPRLLDLHEKDLPLRTRSARRLRAFAAGLVGASHTGSKLAVLAVSALVAFAFLGQTTRLADAPFSLEPMVEQVETAPFDGYVEHVSAQVGDRVSRSGMTLAGMDVSELELQLAEARAERTTYLKQEAVHHREAETGKAHVALARAEQVRAQIALLEYKIERAVIKSDIDGVIVQSHLDGKVGARVNQGDLLFQIAHLDSLRAVLSLPEEEAPDVGVGMRGHLATASHPGVQIPFEIAVVQPAADVVDQRNVFTVHARLLERPSWLRPGMRGAARVELETCSYAEAWTRKLVNWIRMKLWI